MLMDLVLLLRIMTLKLSRTYVFISLFAVLNLFYDGIGIWLGLESTEFTRVVIFSKFVFAIVYPLVTWDLFEEAKPALEKIRQLAMSRMISSLVFITLWGLLIAAFTGEENSPPSQYLMRLALVVWTGSVAAALAFLWVMRRGIKAGQIPLPHNATVWYRFLAVWLSIEAVECAISLVLPSFQGMASNLVQSVVKTSDPVLQICGIVVTGWCIFKLRSIPSDASDVPAKVNG